MKGAVRRVVLRGEVACIDGVVVAKPGFGKHVTSSLATAEKIVTVKREDVRASGMYPSYFKKIKFDYLFLRIFLMAGLHRN